MASDRPPLTGIGIDLGTSNSAVCRVQFQKGRPSFDYASDLSGGKEIVSAIYVDSNGHLYHGRGAARRQADGNEQERVLSNLKLKLRSNEPLEIGEGSFTPVDLMRGFIAYLKRCYERRLSDGQALNRAVITVPAGANFDVDYRENLQAAIGGTRREPLFDEWEMLEEPDAALLSLVDLKPLDGQRVLVFDMGGGTLDVSIRTIEATEGQPKLLSGGLEGSFAAGATLTDRLTDLAVERWSGNTGRTFSEEERVEVRRRNFWRADEVKLLLSAAAVEDDDPWSKRPYDLHLSYGAHNHSVSVTAADLSELSLPLAEQAKKTVLAAISDAGLTPRDINSYFMVGGSSQLPLIRDMMRDLFAQDANPAIGPYGKMDTNLAVVRGASLFSLQGYTNSSAPKSKALEEELDGVILPALERRLGYPISLVGMSQGQEVAVALIPKGTQLPSLSVSKTVYMPQDAAHLDLRLMRGEGDPRLCTPLEQRRIAFDEPREEGAAVKISVSVSGDGRFAITTDDEGLLVAATTTAGASA